MKKIITACLLVIGVTVGTRAQHKEGNTYQIATFNIRMDTEKDGLNAWSHRKDMVNGLLKYHELDIIGTQEGFKHQLDDISRIDYLKYVGVGRDDGQQGGEHSAIFYNTDKFEVLDNGDYWYSETPDKPGKGWDAVCCNRICSWVKLKDRKNGKQFFVFSSHFDHQGVKARAESAKLMLKKIAEISKGAPVIALGDFNATPDSEPIVTIKNTLKDAFDISETAPYGPVGTTNAFKWDAPMKQRIDYIFVNSGVQVLKYASLVDALNMRFPSDHLPVIAKVRID